MTESALAARIADALPQTQCRRCGYPDCQSYAEAVAHEGVAINRCPPGGAEGIAALAALTGRSVLPLDPECGSEQPMTVAVIDTAWCIGCTLCLAPCPTDAIVGSHKLMHAVLPMHCTGCELCIPVCPVDCIAMLPAASPDWSPAQADAARVRYQRHQARSVTAAVEHTDELIAKAEHKLAHLPELTKGLDEDEQARKRRVVEAALAKARARRGLSSR